MFATFSLPVVFLFEKTWTYPLVMTNIAMENPENISGGFVRWENHLFNYGPWLYHGELLVITRGYIF